MSQIHDNAWLLYETVSEQETDAGHHLLHKGSIKAKTNGTNKRLGNAHLLDRGSQKGGNKKL